MICGNVGLIANLESHEPARTTYSACRHGVYWGSVGRPWIFGQTAASPRCSGDHLPRPNTQQVSRMCGRTIEHAHIPLRLSMHIRSKCVSPEPSARTQASCDTCAPHPTPVAAFSHMLLLLPYMASLCLLSGECTEVALDLDRRSLHVYHSASNGERGIHQVVPLSKVCLASPLLAHPRVRLLAPGYAPGC